MTYRPGDFWRICDVCGFKMRASQTVKRWDGLMVCLADFEERHPQDFVRGHADRQNVPDPRPEPVDTIIGPLTTVTTAASSPGSATLTVESSARFLVNDSIGVMLSDGTLHPATVDSLPDTLTITLTAGLPGTVSSGALVNDYSAISEPDIG